ncbi:uncharacterized protein SAPINGB_P002370 [Magnusiomyces paraingens]|uniref:Mitochondrial resolvase Ydc2 catalytic domain-containing protein n=1 Tax=Magnusiomyces paraingens TaxID=2606893 RepID=A0A5E8BFN5_9ASCO|nr:uncharacterized protein SAPINGB_P002370 [Saprochaete ingens]VVT49641.1 unnamed protein product [Saprochaete ingens]
MAGLRIGVLKEKLVSLCALTGVGSTGTKQELMTRLLAETYSGQSSCNDVKGSSACKPPHSKRLVKVVSIDMGIRNLSISQFLWRIPASNQFYFPPQVTRDLSGKVNQGIIEKHQSLLDQALISTPSVLELIGRPFLKEESPHLIYWDRLDLDTMYKGEIAINGWEPYGPAHISYIAQNLLHDQVLMNTHDADDIVLLLERQRFRSGGASQVLEWTLRVNMLEIALFSGATTVRSNSLHNGGNSKRNGKGVTGIHVYSIAPKRVVGYWREQFPMLEVQDSGNSYRDNKQWKINVAARVLSKSQDQGNDNGKGVIRSTFLIPHVENSVTEQVRVIKEAGWGSFKEERIRNEETLKIIKEKKEDKKIKKTSKKIKVDDLADSFLQGLAWMGFQRGIWNMSAIIGNDLET